MIKGSGKVNGMEVNLGTHFVVCHDEKAIELSGRYDFNGDYFVVTFYIADKYD